MTSQLNEPSSQRSPKNAESQKALSDNERLLADHPILQNFWDKKRWIVDEARLHNALREASGMDLCISAKTYPPNQDLHKSQGDYSASIITDIGKASVEAKDLRLDDLYDLSTFPFLMSDELLTHLEPSLVPLLNAGPFEKYQDECGALFSSTEFKYFQLSHPALDKLCGDGVRGKDFREARAAAFDHIHATVDKVSQRRIAELIGEFEQPAYIDLRAVNTAQNGVKVSAFDFSAIPLDKLCNICEQRRIWIFEDDEQGFAIISEKGKTFVSSRNLVLQRAAASFKLNEASDVCSPDESIRRIKSFFSYLESCKSYSFMFLADREEGDEKNQIQKRLDTANLVLGSDSSVYLKSTRTAGGQMVLKINRKSNTEVSIESDSSELGAALAEQFKTISRTFGITDSALLTPAAKRIVASTAIDRLANLDRFLHHILGKMPNPIVEREIPATRLGTARVEFRLICHSLLDDKGEQKTQVTAHYCKYSMNEIAANISIGGRGKSSLEVLTGLYRQQLPQGVDERIVEAKANEDLERLLLKSLRFAKQYRTIQLANSNQQLKFNSFAVDILPVWNEKLGNFDFHLLEVQHKYAFTGLWDTNPAAAQQVELINRRLDHESARSGRFPNSKLTFSGLAKLFAPDSSATQPE